jgi:hypothetical protein
MMMRMAEQKEQWAREGLGLSVKDEGLQKWMAEEQEWSKWRKVVDGWKVIV